MKGMKKDIKKFGFDPILKSKYLIILLMLGVLAIMAPSFVMRYHLWVFYVVMGFIALIVLGLYQHIRFQKLHRILRPFIVVKILQVFTSLSFPVLVYFTYEMAQNAPIPFAIFWVLAVATIYQFFSIFRLAKQAKKDFPDRCEFC